MSFCRERERKRDWTKLSISCRWWEFSPLLSADVCPASDVVDGRVHHTYSRHVCVCVCTYICMGDGWAHHSSRHGGNITSGNRRDERHQVVGSSSAPFMFMEMFALVNTNRHASTQLVTELHLFCHLSTSFSKKYCIGIFYFYKIDFYILQKMSRNILDTFMQMNMVPFWVNE